MTYIDSWKKYLAAQEFSPGTIELYERCVTQCLMWIGNNFGVTDPEKIDSGMLESWMIDHQRWSAGVKKYNYNAVKKFFRYLVGRNAIDTDPSTILVPGKVAKHIDESAIDTKEDRVYSPENLKAMLDYVPYQKSFVIRDQAIIALMAGTGMRASEVCWLTVGQIRRREGNTIFALRKGQNIKRVTIAEFALPYIFRYLGDRRMRFGEIGDDEPLFLTKRRNGITRVDIYNMLSVRQKALGLRTGTHNMRYTVINAVERSASPTVARDIAGQKSIAITNNYLVSSQTEREHAVDTLPWSEKLKFDRDLDELLAQYRKS